MSRSKPETLLSKAIADRYDALGFWQERVQSGQFRMPRGYVHGAKKGFPDRWTPYFLLEVKVPGGKLRPEQVECHKRLREHGVAVEVAESVEQAVKFYVRHQEARRFERAQGWV